MTVDRVVMKNYKQLYREEGKDCQGSLSTLSHSE